MGFCVFNNIAIAATHALAHRGLERIAIIDYDVHHGNGTQVGGRCTAVCSTAAAEARARRAQWSPRHTAMPDEIHVKTASCVRVFLRFARAAKRAFYEDDRVLFISLHQDSNYPPESGEWCRAPRTRRLLRARGCACASQLAACCGTQCGGARRLPSMTTTAAALPLPHC
jgi:hypothetical protein